MPTLHFLLITIRELINWFPYCQITLMQLALTLHFLIASVTDLSHQLYPYFQV